LDGDRVGTADVRNDDRWADIARTVALHPSILGEAEALEVFTEVLNHVITLRFTVDEEIKANILLEFNDALNLLLDELVVLLLGDGTFSELSTGLTDLLGLLGRY
jgi:hypothetical protein